MSARLIWLALFGRWARRRTFMLAVLSAVSTIVVLAAAAAPLVATHERDRLDAQQPIAAETGQRGPLGYTSSLIPHGRGILKVALATFGSDAPVPPGIPELPAAGHLFLSPSLASLIATDEVAAAYFPERVDGVIAAEGLSQPGQLLAYAGTSPASFAPDGAGVLGFGIDNRVGGFAWYAVLAVLILLVIPAMASLIVGAHADAKRRSARAHALHEVGVDPRFVRVLNFLDVAVPALAGSFGGGLLALAVARRADVVQIPVVDRLVFGSDLDLSWPLLLACLVTPSLVAATVSTIVTTRRRPGAARSRSWRRGTLASSALLLTGLGVLVVQLLGHGTSSLVRVGAFCVMAVSLPLTVIGLGHFVGKLAGDWLPLPALLGLRRLRGSPGSAGSLMAVASIVAFALTSALPLAATLGETVRWNDVVGNSVMARVVSGLPGDSLRLRSRPPTQAYATSLGVWSPSDDRGTPPRYQALVGSCEELETLFATALPGCRPGVFKGTTALTSDQSLELRTTSGDQARAITVDDAVLSAPANPIGLTADLIVTRPIAETDDLFVTSAWARIPATTEAVHDVSSAWAGTASLSLIDIEGMAAPQQSSVEPWLVLFVVLAGLLAFASILTLAPASEGASERRALLIAGADHRLDLVATVIAAAATTLIAMALVTVCGGIVSAALAAGLTQSPPGPTAYLPALTGLLAVGLLGTLLDRFRLKASRAGGTDDSTLE